MANGDDAANSADSSLDAREDAEGDASDDDDDAQVDAGTDADADADAGPLERVTFHVEYNGGVSGATVTMLAPWNDTTTTDPDGDFYFYVPVGSNAVFKVTPPTGTDMFPMIRGIHVEPITNRVRTYYMAGPAEVAAVTSLGKTFDPTKGVLEIDFRNAQVGGYGATLTNPVGGATITPGFGVAFDNGGAPVLSLLTLVGGNGSTLLLADVPAGMTNFTPIVPTDAGLPCIPCDGPGLPVQPNVVTWYDYECGVANCQ